MRRLAVVGGLGAFPAVRLALPPRRLLSFLAVHGTEATRSFVAGILWADVPDVQARANLRRALWQTPPGWVVAQGDTLRLDAEVDLPELHAIACAAIEGATLTMDDVDRLSHDLLPGWHEEWVLGPQEAFRLLRVQALEAACVTLTAQGAHAVATQAGTAALVADPLRESAAFALIQAHLHQGNRHAAASRYRAFALTLERELGVEPHPALAEAVHAAVSRSA